MITSHPALVIPAAYHATQLEEHRHSGNSLVNLVAEEALPDHGDVGLSGLLTISRGTSILLLLIYVAYLYFQLKTHAHLFEAPVNDDPEAVVEEEGAKMNMVSAAVWYAECGVHIVRRFTDKA